MDAKRRAAERDKEKRCVVCGEIFKTRRRGLCTQHYEQFRRKRDKLTEEAGKAWEEQLVGEGKLMPARQGRRLSGQEDAFAASFAAFAEKMPGAIWAAASEDVEQYENAGDRVKQASKEEPQSIDRKKKTAKKAPTKRIETDEQSRTKRKKSG